MHRSVHKKNKSQHFPVLDIAVSGLFTKELLSRYSLQQYLHLTQAFISMYIPPFKESNYGRYSFLHLQGSGYIHLTSPLTPQLVLPSQKTQSSTYKCSTQILRDQAISFLIAIASTFCTAGLSSLTMTHYIHECMESWSGSKCMSTGTAQTALAYSFYTFQRQITACCFKTVPPWASQHYLRGFPRSKPYT